MSRRSLLPGILLLLLPCAVDAQEISSPVEYRPQAFDVLSYDLFLDLTKAPTPEAWGNCEILVHWVGTPSGGFSFHLRSMEVDSVFYNGIRTEATAVGTPADPTYHFRVPAPGSAATGDTARIRIHYHGAMTNEGGAFPWGGVSSDNGILYALGVGFANNYVSATEHWMPCYDHPSDKATFRGQFLVRRPNVVASNGRGSSLDLGDSSTMYVWSTDIPTATYLLTFACGPYQILEMSGAIAPIVLYAKATDTAATRRSFSLLPRMIAAYEGRFGSYPFEKVGYCNTAKGAMEHQTMVSFPESIARSGDTVNAIGAHELSHQWFGDFVSPLDYRHAWLNESFATWCESIWMEELGGFARYLTSQESKMSSYISGDARREGILPLYDFPRASPSSNYPATIYNKGAVVVGMLRYELGDSLFFEALREYLRRHAYGVATTNDMETVMEEYAGRPLDWFFDQWVRRPGWPVFRLNVRHLSSTGTLNRARVTLTQTPNGTPEQFVNVPVELGFRDSSGAYTYRMIRASGPETIVEIDSLPPYASVNVNKGPSLRTLLQAPQISSVAAGFDGDGPATVTVVPNPTSAGTTDIAITLEGVGECRHLRYTLFDVVGRELVSGASDTCAFHVSLDDLDPGLYILHVRHKGGTHDAAVVVGD